MLTVGNPAEGNKLGLVLGVWACWLLVASGPQFLRLAVVLAVLIGVVLTWRSVSDGVMVGLYALSGCLLVAELVRAWLEFGTRADADRLVAAELERRIASRLLDRQVTLMREVADATASGRRSPGALVELVDDAESYLYPTRSRGNLRAVLDAALERVSSSGCALDVALDCLDADLPMACAEAVTAALTEILSVLTREARPAPVSVRATGDSDAWQVSVLGDGEPMVDRRGATVPPGLDAALFEEVWARLRQAGVTLDSRALPGGGLHVLLYPARLRSGRNLP
jgi:hypothetical protein